jgi:hypothetical protein
MVWAKLDDAILDNAKIAQVGVFGFAMHVAAITWCCRNLTDGFIPSSRIHCLLNLGNASGEVTAKLRSNCTAASADVDRLCDAWMDCGEIDATCIANDMIAAGLWEAANGGYMIHDFLVYNPSRKQVLEERERGRERAKASIAKRKASPEAAPKLRRNFTRTSDGPVPVPVPVNTNPPIGSPPSAEPRVRRGSRLPVDWVPSPDTLAALSAEGCTNAKEALPAFRDYWFAVPGQRGVKLDWEGTYRNWVRRDSMTTRGDRSSKVQRGLAAHTALSIAKNDLMAELDAKAAQEGGYDASF